MSCSSARKRESMPAKIERAKCQLKWNMLIQVCTVGRSHLVPLLCIAAHFVHTVLLLAAVIPLFPLRTEFCLTGPCRVTCVFVGIRCRVTCLPRHGAALLVYVGIRCRVTCLPRHGAALLVYVGIRCRVTCLPRHGAT
jgi:hypothetical protein